MNFNEIMMTAEAVLIGILLAAFIIREIFTYRERQKLLDRIMAKNYGEFREEKEPEYKGTHRVMSDEEEASLEDSK